jgi:hypothetical protein
VRITGLRRESIPAREHAGLSALELQFHEQMLDVYRIALTKAHYKATVFLRMMNEHGGSQAARVSWRHRTCLTVSPSSGRVGTCPMLGIATPLLASRTDQVAPRSRQRHHLVRAQPR